MYLQAVKLQQRHLPECHAGTSSLTHAWQLGKALLQQGRRLVAFLPGVGDKGQARVLQGVFAACRGHRAQVELHQQHGLQGWFGAGRMISVE